MKGHEGGGNVPWDNAETGSGREGRGLIGTVP